MKFLVLFAVLAVAYLLWRNARIERRQAPPPEGAARPPAAPQEMVRCPTCGLHLPRSDALAGADGQFYCSAGHQRTAGH